MVSIAHWNRRQILVFSRFSRRYRVPLTPEVISRLARRFALKHVRAIADGRGPHGHPRPDPQVSSRPTPADKLDVTPARPSVRATRPWRARRLVRLGLVYRVVTVESLVPPKRRSTCSRPIPATAALATSSSHR